MIHTPEPAPGKKSAPPRILLIRLRSIGDILFTGPAVRVVRENFPDAAITFLVAKEHAALMEGFPDVDGIVELDRALYSRGNPLAIVAETLALLRRLRRSRFSLAVDFQGYGETALLAWCTGAGHAGAAFIAQAGVGRLRGR